MEGDPQSSSSFKRRNEVGYKKTWSPMSMILTPTTKRSLTTAIFQLLDPDTQELSLRRKRIRRDISIPYFLETTFGVQQQPLEQQSPQPLDIAQAVHDAVSAMNAARPIGGKDHLKAVQSLRQLLSHSDKDPPFHQALHAGAIPALIQALQPPKFDTQAAIHTIFEAAWALTNLAVGDAQVVRAVAEAAPILIAYASGESGLVLADQCAWALGNIAGEDVEYREILVANGVIHPLTKLMQQGVKECMKMKRDRGYGGGGGGGKEGLMLVDEQEQAIEGRKKEQSQQQQQQQQQQHMSSPQLLPIEITAATTAAWALGNIMSTPHAVGQFIGVQDSLESLIQGMKYAPDMLAEELAWVAAAVTSSHESHVNRVATLGMLHPLTMRIRSAIEDMFDDCPGSAQEESMPRQERGRGIFLLIPLLRCYGNIIAVAGRRTIDEDIMHAEERESTIDSVVICAECSHHALQREAAWALGNIAGLPDRKGIEMLCRSRAVPVLKHLLKNEHFFVKKEAAFALTNILAGGGGGTGDAEAMNALFGGDLDAVRAMVSLLRSVDMDAALLGLQFVEMFLRVLPSGKQEIEAVDGIEALEVVQFAGNAPGELRESAGWLVDKYWGIAAGE